MTAADFNAMVTKFGKRISALIFDNHQIVLVNYSNKNPVNLDEIKVETIGGTDYVAVPQVSSVVDHVTKTAPTYKTYHLLDCLQSVVVMDEEFAKFRVDPINLM